MSIENLPSNLDPNDPLVKQAQQGKGWGAQDQARYDALKNRQSAKSKAQSSQGSSGQAANAIDNTQTAKNDAVPGNQEINFKNSQEQNINQDNDITSNVTGDNNTVINEQDNSIRNYGGDNRKFVYNSKGGKGTDTPVSAATMSGFYDVDDSPAAQAKFNDMYTTMNRDNQKRYAGQAMKTFAKFGNMDARGYTPESMEKVLNASKQESYDRSTKQTGFVFGDIYNPNYITSKYELPEPATKIESNAAELAKQAKEDIEDL